jgi:RTX calcium-binding nonapeptide repeat (4 copies)
MKGRSGLVRRLSLGSFVALGLAMLALGGARGAAAQETLAASCQPTENIFHGATGDRLFAQPFSPQLSGDLTRAELRLRKVSGTGDWIFQIRAAQPSGSFPGELEPTPTVLASATLPDASVPDGTDSTESVVFPSPAAVVAGGAYALSVTRPTATDPNSLAVAAHTPDTDCPNRLYDSNNGGANWTGQDLDTIFRVFVTTPASVPPVTPIPPVTATCNGEPTSSVGTNGNDEIVGTSSHDVIAALGGNDKVSGLSGNDLICGGAGKDTLTGGKGKDKLFGEAGNDTLKGGPGKDKLRGGPGKDKQTQ